MLKAIQITITKSIAMEITVKSKMENKNTIKEKNNPICLGTF
jgi:hypothetical protein